MWWRQGLSPPTRGSLPPRRPATLRAGSIPAHAGKPRKRVSQPVGASVYPHPRGEAPSGPFWQDGYSGLSPPTRGSRRERCDSAPPTRSIPAHAGKPETDTTVPWELSVYPRPRGEANTTGSMSPFSTGLSPPTRGSRVNEPTDEVEIGSIPAHAGKPHGRSRIATFPAVYPRPRGEAATSTS